METFLQLVYLGLVLGVSLGLSIGFWFVFDSVASLVKGKQ